jgi:hypothetical protein
MTIYNVYVFRQMRLLFENIEADTHEKAASIACEKPTSDADDIDDCDGDSFYACVDVHGDSDYEQSRWIDFEPERERAAASSLLHALRFALEFLQANDDGEIDVSLRIASARSAIAKAEAAGIPSESARSELLPALEAVLPYAWDERASLRECWQRDDDPRIKAELRQCDRAIENARAAIAEARATNPPSATRPTATELYDTLRYVAERLSGFKPDFLANIGLDVALEKCSAALDAFEAIKARAGDHE